MTRPRVALVMTTWHEDSHADVIATRLVAGYEWDGVHSGPRVEVVAAYLEQRGVTGATHVRPDTGVAFLAAHGVRLYPTPAEALGAGSRGVGVDGVVIVGEHGDYEKNEYGQKLYPRRRLFDACLAAMIAAGRFVPVFNDKHLAWNLVDALAVRDNARRLGVPLGAGSSIPLCWRRPQGVDWPYATVMDKAVAAGGGEFESYGFHTLEALQAFTERRAGGEAGVVEVRGFDGIRVDAGLARIDPELARTAIAAQGGSAADVDVAMEQINGVITIRHADGLESAIVSTPSLWHWSVAAQGPGGTTTCEFHRQPAPHSHFVFLVRAIESLILMGEPSWPVERTLLTGGILDHGIRNARGAADPESPQLSIAYTVPEHIPDTGVPLGPYELRRT